MMSQNRDAAVGSSENGGRRKYRKELTVLTSLFFIWGFLTCLNDILIPHLKSVFSLNYAQAMLIQFTFFGAYFLVSLPSGFILKKVGYKRGIIIGLTVAGIGCLIFYPAAGLRSYSMFLAALFILASGITLLQVSANPYVTVLGEQETASSRLNLTQAFNSLGTTIAPFFGSLLILSLVVKSAEEMAKMNAADIEAYRLMEASAVQTPYLFLAATLFIIAAVFSMFKLPEISNEEDSLNEEITSESSAKKSAWEYRHLVMGAIGIFVYVGAEVAIGSFLINFFGEKSIAGLTEFEAGKYVAYYWGGAMVGRFIGSAVMQKVNPRKVLAFNAMAAITLVITATLLTGSLAMWAILLVGLFNSIMFPTIFSLSLEGLGKHTSQGSGILCMAIVGGAIIPIIQGLLADSIGIQNAFVLPAICYLYILVFAIKGSASEKDTVQEYQYEG